MMKTIYTYLLLVSSIVWLASCFPQKIGVYSNVYTDQDLIVPLGGKTRHELTVLYTGCGGLVINAGGHSVLVDPFYSNRCLKMAYSKLRTDRRQADLVCRRIDQACGGTEAIRSVLIAHSHYDHLLDLPYLLNTRLKSHPPHIIGSASTRNALASLGLPPYRFTAPEFPGSGIAETIPLDTGMRVTVIASEHSPHFRLLGTSVSAMDGCIGPKGVKGFDTSNYKAWCWKWEGGPSYSFLLEIDSRDRPEPLRVFIQSTPCNPPAGIPQLADPSDSVDIAFIGVASTNFVCDYPKQLLQAIRPKYVVLIHWEDFFRKYGKEPKFVRATKPDLFFCRYREVMGADYQRVTSMPKQLVRYKFLY
jgi:L-ascorbate metabolism protein UlaG (beta-lactamase superfamily)